MVNNEPIDRDFLLREIRELLGVSIREETHFDGRIVMVGGDPGEVIVREQSRACRLRRFAI
jgi:hypothetical protein